MVFAGRYFCRVRELRPIEFGMYEMVPTTATPGDMGGDVEAQNGVDGSVGSK